MGFDFLQAAFLGGLLAAAIPVVIHLMHRRKSRTLPFPTLRFLKEVDVRTARRSRLRERLILALRVAALAFLALALARPVLRGSGFLGRGRSSRVYVIDNSLSMDARREGSSALERCRLAALELVSRMEPADRAAVVALQGPPEAPALSESRRDLEATLLAIRPTQLSTPLLEAAGRAYRLLERDTNPVREVFIFSDLQATAVPRGAAAPPAPGKTRTVLLTPRGPVSPNLSVEGVAVVPAGGRKVALRVKVRNTGDQAAGSTLTVRVDRKLVEERSLRIAAGGEEAVSLEPLELAPGLHRGEAVLGEDPLLADNVHGFALEVPQAVRVLLARDSGASPAHRDPAFYLAQALRPAAAAGEVKVKVGSTAELASEDLSGFEVVILAEPALVAEAAIARMSEFLLQGGGLLFIAGPGQSPEALEPWGVRPLLPGRLELVVRAREEPFHLKDWKADHPIWEPLLSSSPPLQLLAPRFLAYWKATPAPQAAVLARFTTGDPALLELAVGRGRSLLLTTTARPEWNNLPLKFSFLPLVHSAVRYLGGSSRSAAPHPLGAPLVLRYAEGTAPAEVSLEPPPGDGPAGERLKVQPRPGEGGVLTAELGRLERTGVYVVEERYPARRSHQPLVVNPDPLESDLKPLGDERIQELFPGARRISFDSPRDAARAALEVTVGSELKNPLLFLLLLFIFLEPVLANAVAFRRAKAAGLERAARVAA
jgi:hypothetical protein